MVVIVTAAGSGRGSSDVREHYLGPLYPMEEYKMLVSKLVIVSYIPVYIYANHTHYRYGYATNTRVKFIIITENTASISRDQEIAQVHCFI